MFGRDAHKQTQHSTVESAALLNIHTWRLATCSYFKVSRGVERCPPLPPASSRKECLEWLFQWKGSIDGDICPKMNIGKALPGQDMCNRYIAGLVSYNPWISCTYDASRTTYRCQHAWNTLHIWAEQTWVGLATFEAGLLDRFIRIDKCERIILIIPEHLEVEGEMIR